MTPTPYSISHTPGIAATAPACHSATVNTAPASNGGRKLKRNLRAGADQNGSPAARDLRHMAATPTAIASAPSASQMPNHSPRDSE
jgi:hypothetical protein